MAQIGGSGAPTQQNLNTLHTWPVREFRHLISTEQPDLYPRGIVNKYLVSVQEIKSQTTDKTSSDASDPC